MKIPIWAPHPMGAPWRVTGGSIDHSNSCKSNYLRVKHSADENQGLKVLSQQKLSTDRCHVNNITCSWEPIPFCFSTEIHLAQQDLTRFLAYVGSKPFKHRGCAMGNQHVPVQSPPQGPAECCYLTTFSTANIAGSINRG